jgi:SAM-dependent methyltransferase
VRFDRPLLGDVAGLRGVHLQCHIGTDTISLARLGASMTGLDFSGPAIEAATELASKTADDATFVRSDVYSATSVLEPASFDFVYTGIGALHWLPSIRRWADVVAALLRPGGRLFVREIHPVLDAIEVRDGRLSLEYPYFEQSEPMTWDNDGTYVQTDARMEHSVMHVWNHGIGETVTALLQAGMRITGLTEHDTIPVNSFHGLMEPVTPRRMAGSEWRLAENPARLPHSFTLQAVKDVKDSAR